MATMTKQCKCPNQDTCKHKWREQVMKDGKRKWITLASTKTAAKRISDKKRGDRALQQAGIPLEKSDEPVYLLAAHVQEYLNYAKADHPATATTKDEPTLATFLKAVGNQDLKQLDALAIERWRQGRLKVWSRGRLLSKQTVNRELNIVKGCLTWAETMGRLEFSPARKVKPWKTDDYERPILQSPADYAAITRMEMPHRLINLVTLRALCRLSEVCSLKRADLSPSHAPEPYITVRRKGGKRDKVPVDAALMKDLRQQLKTPEQVYLFPHQPRRLTTPRKNAWAQGWICPANVSVYNTRFFRAEGLHGISNHALRHTGTTVQQEAGTDASTLQVMGGWTSRRMLDIYGHATNKSLRQAVQVGQEHYEAVMKQAKKQKARQRPQVQAAGAVPQRKRA
jgi:integrase